jgi:hypothetical protein
VRKFAPDCCTDLRHLFGRSAEPVEPRHQRGVQACRDGECRPGNHGNGLRRRAQAFRFQHRFRHFFHKQRNAIGSIKDVLPDIRWQWLIARDPVNHRLHFEPR